MGLHRGTEEGGVNRGGGRGGAAGRPGKLCPGHDMTWNICRGRRPGTLFISDDALEFVVRYE